MKKNFYAIMDRANGTLIGTLMANNDVVACQRTINGLPDDVDKKFFSLVCAGTLDDETLEMHSDKRFVCKFDEMESFIDREMARIDAEGNI